MYHTQITVDYEGIPMWWRHVGILLFKTPTLRWMWSSGALIQVSALWYYFEVSLEYLKKKKKVKGE